MNSIGFRRERLWAFAVVVLVNALVLGYFYDRFWWPPDDGHYAHVAERVLAGEVLHADIRDFHTDYVHLVHVLALKLFGTDLLSLRVPLVVITLMQSCLMFLLFAECSFWTAPIGALSLTALSCIQFLNPQPHWYCLFLAVVVIWFLKWRPRGSRGRLEILGFLVATVYLFRQLTGVFLGMGVLTYLLVESCDMRRGREVLFARGILAAMFLALVGYYRLATNAVGVALFGVWPLAVLGWSMFRSSVSNQDVARMLVRMTLGGIAALLPVLAYHTIHGSLGGFVSDTMLNATRVHDLWYIDVSSYTSFLLLGLHQLIQMEGIARILNGIYWVTLPLLAALNGVLMLRYLYQLNQTERLDGVVPFIAVFFALVSIFNQIPIYLYYSVGLSLAGVLWLGTLSKNARPMLGIVLAVVLAAVAVHYQAAQPISRKVRGIAAGQRVVLVYNDRFDRARLWFEARDIDAYGELIELIRRETSPSDPIFVFPNHPEVYFLAHRRNPFAFVNTSLAITNERELNEVMKHLSERKPRLVIHAQYDRHNTPRSDVIVLFVRRNYDLISTVAGFRIYRRR